MKTYSYLTCLCAISLILSACGSGGGGAGGSSSTNSTTTTTTTTTATSNPATTNSNPTTTVTNNPAITSTTNTVTPTTADYTPSVQLLDSVAANSNDLYVKESFAFDQTQTVNLMLSVHNADATAASFKKVAVYALPDNAESFTDEDLVAAPLLLLSITDEQGEVHQQVEWPANIKIAAIKVDTLGIQADAVVKIESAQISHSFQ